MSPTSKLVEYRIHYGANGDSYDVHCYEGKHWRKWKQHIGEEGVQWIERVVETWCNYSKSILDAEYETLWESDECTNAEKV